MQFRRIRAVVLGAGVGLAVGGAVLLTSGCSNCSTDEATRVINDDGRACEDQCATVATSTTASLIGTYAGGSVVITDCEKVGGAIRCEFDVTRCGEGRAPSGLALDLADETMGSLAHEMARMAAVEASSVQPFLALSDALRERPRSRRGRRARPPRRGRPLALPPA